MRPNNPPFTAFFPLGTLSSLWLARSIRQSEFQVFLYGGFGSPPFPRFYVPRLVELAVLTGAGVPFIALGY